MNLEKQVNESINKALENGIVEKAINQQLEKAIGKAVEDILGHWGDGTKIIEQKIKECMIPQIEKYDFSEHIVKLDTVLTEILKSTTLDNKKILNNFKNFMSNDVPENIKMSDIFEKYCEFVSQNAKSDDLDVEFDDGPHYESFEVTFEVEENEDRDWSSFEYAVLRFECEHDENMNFEATMSKYKNDDYWTLRFRNTLDLRSLRNVDEFEIFLTKIDQNGCRIEMDETYGSEDITLEKEPEATFE